MSEEPRDESPDEDEPGTDVQTVVPMPIAVFEGEFVTEMEGRLPAVIMEMPEGYARGTHLRLNLEVRVKNVRYEENRKGDLTRQHVFALESIHLATAFSPEDAADSVGGSASGRPEQTAEDAEALGGLTIGRTSEVWGGE